MQYFAITIITIKTRFVVEISENHHDASLWDREPKLPLWLMSIQLAMVTWRWLQRLHDVTA